MKFGCDKCNAKYNIADEKVIGRTLRMTCRKCAAEIIIHGKELAAAPPSAPVTPVPEPVAPVPEPVAPASKPAASPSEPPTARQPSIPSSGAPLAAALTPKVPTPGEAPIFVGEAVWHVSINDVPVGPITLEELTHKMESNAISEYSLVWRNDFDEWRPLATVPDLMSLLVHQRESVPPAGRPASLTGLAAVTLNPFGEGSSQPPRFSSRPHASAPPSPSSPPAQSAPPTNGHSPSGGFAAMTAANASSHSHAPSRQPLARESTAMPNLEVHVAKPGPTMGALVLVVLAMGASFAAGFFARGFMPKAEPQATDAYPQSNVNAVEPAPNIERKVELEFDMADEEAPPVSAKPTKEPAQEERDAAPIKRAVKRIEPSEPTEEALSENDKRLLAKFGSGADAAPAKIKLDNPLASNGNSKEPLDEDAVKRTVTKGQPGLKRCYERAIRGQALAPSVRIDVMLEVAPSGRVSKVTTKGSAPGGLAQCIEGQIARWRFPASAGGEAGFPVVFSGG